MTIGSISGASALQAISAPKALPGAAALHRPIGPPHASAAQPAPLPPPPAWSFGRTYAPGSSAGMFAQLSTMIAALKAGIAQGMFAGTGFDRFG